MLKVIGMMLLLIGVSGAAMASTAPVPEIDASSAASALALISGALLMVRRSPKK